MVVICGGKVMDIKDEQSRNAELSMEVTDDGMSRERRPEHP